MDLKRATDKKLKLTDGIDGEVIVFAATIMLTLTVYVYLMF